MGYLIVMNLILNNSCFKVIVEISADIMNTWEFFSFDISLVFEAQNEKPRNMLFVAHESVDIILSEKAKKWYMLL